MFYPLNFKSLPHLVFGASNVSKMLMEVPESQRSDTAANNLVYEAHVRVRDPVYGCMGDISALQQQVQSLQAELNAVRDEIIKYKCRETNLIPPPSSHVPMLSPGDVSVAAPPPSTTQPPPLPPPPPPFPTATAVTTCSIYTQPTAAVNYSTISKDNVSYFG
ncbi:LOB domain-containing protein 15 [Hibiscus syriacus]|uniref:LOB domain-containing protein 15 n=2 Tax=Hibiscus syriacus TaxID=106335 RepID=A0A6A3C3C4_HIBSY|nr:LOB domain-containing protein 15 [Hibiscus syriacus]